MLHRRSTSQHLGGGLADGEFQLHIPDFHACWEARKGIFVDTFEDRLCCIAMQPRLASRLRDRLVFHNHSASLIPEVGANECRRTAALFSPYRTEEVAWRPAFSVSVDTLGLASNYVSG